MSLFVTKSLTEFQNFFSVLIISFDETIWKYCFLAFLLMNQNIAYICCFIVSLNIFVRIAQFFFEIYSWYIWSVLSWREPGSLLFSSPEWTSENKFYWEDEHQNILANPLSLLPSSPRLLVFVQKLKNDPNRSTAVSRQTSK